MAKDKSSLARGQVEASVPTFSLIYIISLTWNFVGYLVSKVAYGAQLTLSVVATSNVLSLGLLGVVFYYLLTPAAQQSSVDWLFRVPILGSILDLGVSTIWFIDATIKMRFTYAHVPSLLARVWESVPTKEQVQSMVESVAAIRAAGGARPSSRAKWRPRRERRSARRSVRRSAGGCRGVARSADAPPAAS